MSLNSVRVPKVLVRFWTLRSKVIIRPNRGRGIVAAGMLVELPAMTIESQSILVALLVFPIGALVLALGWRGRRTDDHPLCRRCGFDLFGLPPGGTTCSECGADLRRRRARIVGHRAKRKGLVAFGAAVLLLCSGWLGLLGWVKAKGVSLQPYKPVW